MKRKVSTLLLGISLLSSLLVSCNTNSTQEQKESTTETSPKSNNTNVYTGNGIPSESIGTSGDVYIDIVSGDIYFKSDTWNKIGTSKEKKESIIEYTYINDDGHLICVLSDGTEEDAGILKNVKYHTVYFYLDGNLIDKRKVVDGSKITAPSSDFADGYIIKSWECKEDGGYLWAFNAYTVTNDLKLYANFDYKNYKVTIETNGLTNKEYTVTYKKNYDFSDVFEDSGYKVSGLIDSKTSEAVPLSGTWEYTEDKTLYSTTIAVNSEDENHGTIKFVSGNYTIGKTFTVKACPKYGYYFKGWYNEDTLIGSNETLTYTVPSSDFTITARFINYTMPSIDKENNIITYGLYPQTHVSDETILQYLNSLNSIDEVTGWYLLDGVYYAKAVSNLYRFDREKEFNEESLPVSISFDDGTNIESKNIYWFKCEPLKWNILSSTNDSYTVVSSRLIDSMRYNDYYGTDVQKDGHYASNYSVSEMRTWLNNTFYTKAFFAGNSFIDKTTVINDTTTTMTTDNTYTCDNTEDYIYLLSYQDYINTSYFENADARTCRTSDYARANGAVFDVNYNGKYWTRTPYRDYIMCNVDNKGELNTYGCDHEEYCARPAMTIKTSK